MKSAKKKTYVIKELMNMNAEREGYEITVKSLSQAKRFAAKNKVFYSTALRIETLGGKWLCHKNYDGQWNDYVDSDDYFSDAF